MSSSKKNILKRIADAKLARTSEQVFSVSDKIEIYKPILPDAETCFKNELESINGQCEIFETQQEMFVFLKKMMEEKNITALFCREENIINQLDNYKLPHTNSSKDFEPMKAAITSCDFLMTRTGSVVVTSASQSGRQLISFPPTHIILANTSQLVNYPENAYQKIFEKYNGNLPSQITTITGPSRTADIEKTLVLGAHGPKELIVLLLKS
ncbi:conserved hypothetical protein [uncultured Paludibacter sp.]|uniref:LUD domain-containing protein n=1 Tax=uncultured Paludibacter sp. TaxID=497635 RepID=A0A653AJ93_9BACT|nr:conserved hypothetical protein [uncultured Paludibacter sp.]